jgi:hypothetical protein
MSIGNDARGGCGIKIAAVKIANCHGNNRAMNPNGPASLYGRLQAIVLAAGLAFLAAPVANAAEFVLVNTSGITIDRLYISPCGGRHWGPNQLAGAPVWSTRAFTVSNIEPGCYDIMVVLPPWNECILAGAALRHGLAWTISKSTVTQAVFGDCSMSPNIVLGGRRPWLTNEP